MSIIWTGLAPHPPIIVPVVGGQRGREAQTTIDALRELCQDMMHHQPERLVLISPHAPRPHRGIGAWDGSRARGSFAQFGAASTRFDQILDPTWLVRLRVHYPEIRSLDGELLDHGSMVPLHFAVEAGWQGPTCIIGLPWDEGEDLDRLGDAVAAACGDDLRTAVLASGDMSHCLKSDGPYGFDPNGPRFDSRFVRHVRDGHYRGACLIEPSLREAAKQDVLESCRVAWRASGFRDTHRHFLSYEGPFGVGYTVMKFYSEQP